MNLGKVSLKRKLISLLTVFLLFVPSCLLIFGDTESIKQYTLTKSSKVSNTKANDETQTSNSEVNAAYNQDLTNEDWSYGDTHNGYTLTNLSNINTQVKLKNAEKYSYISKYIPLSYYNGSLPNTLALDFVNVDSSISHISFYLQGDPKMLLDSGYDTYYEYYRMKIGEYILQPNSTGDTVNLTFDITTAMKELEGHLDTGAKLVMLIESDPQASNSYDGNGELLIKNCMPTFINYANNTISTWSASDNYNITHTPNYTSIEYKNLNDFDYICSYVYNHSSISNILNLELKNIDKSVENITINVYDNSGKVANIPVDLTKYSKEYIHLKYDLQKYNNQLSTVNKIELLIDSNPYKETKNREGNLQLYSVYFSSDRK